MEDMINVAVTTGRAIDRNTSRTTRSMRNTSDEHQREGSQVLGRKHLIHGRAEMLTTLSQGNIGHKQCLVKKPMRR